MTATTTTTTMAVPDVTNMDTWEAARAYAASGIYVLPIRSGTKHPGSRLGNNWHKKSTRDRHDVTAYWAGTNDGIALHMGRSGLVAFDVDHPDQLPQVLADAIDEHRPPYQSTRTTQTGRGHYLFAVPHGRSLGNSGGDLGDAWGQVRGRNGIIVVEPSHHEKAAFGGGYRWEQVGPVPMLPDVLGDMLHDATDADDAATDAVVTEFLKGHVGTDNPAALDAFVRAFNNKVRTGGSRHDAAVSICTGAMKESAAGLYPAADADERLRALFIEAVGDRDRPGRRDARAAASEWAGIRAWAIAQALASDPAATRARVKDKAPPNFGDLFDTSGPASNGSTATNTAPPTDDGVDESTWARIDLKPVTTGDHHQPVPELLRRDDGQSLFYRGHLNGLHGDSGIGKGWVVGHAITQAIRDGHRVLLVDMEDVPASIVARLRLLGLTDAQIIEGVDYRRPQSPLTHEIVDRLCDDITTGGHALVVVDSLGEAFALGGIDENKDAEVGPWLRSYARPLADTGAAVVLIDHSTKSSDNPLHPSGSKRKRAAIGGASYLLEATRPLKKGVGGRLKLTCAKDRHGTYARGEHVADYVMTTDQKGVRVIMYTPDEPGDDGAGTDMAVVAIAAKMVALVKASQLPVNKTMAREMVNAKARSDTKRAALDYAVNAGALAVEPGKGTSQNLVFVRDLEPPK